MARVARLIGVLLIVALLGTPSLRAQSPASDVLVVDRPDALRVVDPIDGDELWRQETGGAIAGAIAAGDFIFASVVGADKQTALYAVAASRVEPELIDRLPGRALVEAVAEDGSALLLVDLPALEPNGRIGSPGGVREVPLPARWRPATTALASRRDLDLGILAPDGRRWYELRQRDADGPSVPVPEMELAILDLSTDESAAVAILALPRVSGYHSLLLAPDGQRLYVVDYLAQAILVIDPVQPAIVDAVSFGRYRTKRPLCAASLSPGGDRLYVLANNGSKNAGDGILIYDTASWNRVGHYLPGEDFYCLAVSADGERLYATELPNPTGETVAATDPWLVTIDGATGRRMDRSPLNLGDCCAFLLTVASGEHAAASPWGLARPR